MQTKPDRAQREIVLSSPPNDEIYTGVLSPSQKALPHGHYNAPEA
jgi:hypothetical protein